MILNGSTDGQFVWFGDDYDSGVTLPTGIYIDDIVGEWHWWEVHLQTLPGGRITVEIYFDDTLVAQRGTNELNTDNQKVALVLFDGTLNNGNTVLFSTRFDEVGISSQKMGVPPG